MTQKWKGVRLASPNMSYKIIIDGFRFIDNLHTTARQLPVFTEIISLLNNKQLHKRILEGLMIDWSCAEEERNELYRLSKGKVTNQNKRTIALRYHLELSPSLGLVLKHNDLYINSKFAKLITHLLKDEKFKDKHKEIEFVFYVYQLLTLDADGIILCLSQLSETTERTQSELQFDFKRALNERLISKQEFVTGNIKVKISEKYKSINYIWRKPEKYAEHLIAPRYEWLSYLGLVKIKRESRKTVYSLTKGGVVFMANLPEIQNPILIKDISANWINECYFSFIDSIQGLKRVNFKSLYEAKKMKLIGVSLENAMKVVHSSMSFKLPIKEAFFFVCIDLLLNENVVIDFEDIRFILKSTFNFNKKAYLLKEAGRINEGYITITNLK